MSPHIGRPPWSKLRAQPGALAGSAGAVTAGAPGAPPRGRPAGRPPSRDPEPPSPWDSAAREARPGPLGALGDVAARPPFADASAGGMTTRGLPRCPRSPRRPSRHTRSAPAPRQPRSLGHPADARARPLVHGPAERAGEPRGQDGGARHPGKCSFRAPPRGARPRARAPALLRFL